MKAKVAPEVAMNKTESKDEHGIETPGVYLINLIYVLGMIALFLLLFYKLSLRWPVQ